MSTAFWGRATWVSSVLAFAACTSAPPAVRDPVAAPPPPVPTASHAAEVPTRASLGPGEFVCGVDDSPVPIGQNEVPNDDTLRRPRPDQLRVGVAEVKPSVLGGALFAEMAAEPPEPIVEAARPAVALAWTFGPHLSTTPAFEQRTLACAELADLGDLGDRTFTVQSTASAGPAAAREATTSSSKFSTCLTGALCLLGSSGAGAGEVGQVRLVTKVEPPVFRGHVTLEITDERRGRSRPNKRRRGGFEEPPPPPRPAAAQAYAKQLAERLRPGAEACAAKRPPAQSFVATIAFVWGKDGKRALPTSRGRRPLVDAFEACLSAAADPLLTRPPPSFNPHDRIPILARVDVSPAPPGMPSSALSPGRP